MIQKHTCEFILSSDLFKGFETIRDEFIESDPPFSWGDNNRSLVGIDDILNHFDNMAFEEASEDELEGFTKRCEEIGLKTYVDLEN